MVLGKNGVARMGKNGVRSTLFIFRSRRVACAGCGRLSGAGTKNVDLTPFRRSGAGNMSNNGQTEKDTARGIWLWVSLGGIVAAIVCAFGYVGVVHLRVRPSRATELDDVVLPDQCAMAAKAMDQVADALEAYWRAHHTYPTDLAELVPSYLAAVPKLPERFEESGGITYKLLGGTREGWQLQPFELSATLLVTLDAPVEVYYHPREEEHVSPTDGIWYWSRYEHIERIDGRWVYCYGTRSEPRRPRGKG